MSTQPSDRPNAPENGSQPVSPPTATDPVPLVPFVVGVTGNMDLVGYDDDFEKCYAASEMKALRAQLFDVLDWVTGLGKADDGRCLNPETGLLRKDASCAADSVTAYHSCWKPLALAKGSEKTVTPVVILSSLAPGLDTIMVEAALDYTNKRKADVKIRCSLPFPEEYSLDASVFNSEGRRRRFGKVNEVSSSSSYFSSPCNPFYACVTAL